MLRAELEKDKSILCLTFNGWLFEGYDDAKTALMGSILDEIQERIQDDNHEIERAQIREDRLGGRLRLEGHADLCAGGADRRDRLPRIAVAFEMEGEVIAARLGERLGIKQRIGDHQMHVERQRAHSLQRPDDGDSDRQIRDEVPVHHVDVGKIGAAAGDRLDLRLQIGKIAGQKRGGNADRQENAPPLGCLGRYGFIVAKKRRKVNRFAQNAQRERKSAPAPAALSEAAAWG